jgi:integrase
MIHLDITKNGSDRHIPLNSTALAAFERLKTAAPKGTAYVFLTSRNDAQKRPVRIKTPRTWFEDVIAESKLKDVTWHTCRHTFVSRLAMAGVDLRTVMELAGHKSMAMTIRYAHLAPEHAAAAIEKIARVSDQLTPELTPRRKGHSRRSGLTLVSR